MSGALGCGGTGGEWQKKPAGRQSKVESYQNGYCGLFCVMYGAGEEGLKVTGSLCRARKRCGETLGTSVKYVQCGPPVLPTLLAWPIEMPGKPTSPTPGNTHQQCGALHQHKLLVGTCHIVARLLPINALHH